MRSAELSRLTNNATEAACQMCPQLVIEFPSIDVNAIVADYEQQFQLIKEEIAIRRKRGCHRGITGTEICLRLNSDISVLSEGEEGSNLRRKALQTCQQPRSAPALRQRTLVSFHSGTPSFLTELCSWRGTGNK